MKLTPIMVTNEGLLRAIHQGGFDNGAAMAVAAGIARNHLARQIATLTGEGLLVSPEAHQPSHLAALSPLGLDALAALDRANNPLIPAQAGTQDGAQSGRQADSATDNPAQAGREADGASDNAAPNGFVWLTHLEICSDPNNARKDFDEAAIAELADSMALKGLLQKPVVRPLPPSSLYQLVMGERRWRAWGLLIERGAWPADHRELCAILEGDDAFADEAGLMENLQRKDLKPLEEGRGFRRLIDVHGRKTKDIAEGLGFTTRFVEQRLQLLHLKPADMAALEKGHKVEGGITIEEARRRLAAYPTPLSAKARLALGEIIDAIATNPVGKDWRGAGAEVEARTVREDRGGNGTAVKVVLDDPVIKELRARAFIDTPARLEDHHIETGRHLIRLTWNGLTLANQEFPGIKDARKRAALLEAWRIAVLGEADADAHPVGRYVTPWLNGPFTVDPVIAAEAAAEKERRAAAAADRTAKAAADQKARDIETAAELKARRAALDFARRFQLPAGPAGHQALRDLIDSLGHPLPWTWIEETDDEAPQLVDANGEDVEITSSYGPPDTLAAVIMALVNAVVGVGPQFQAPEPETVSREDFVAAMAERLAEIYPDDTSEGCAARADELLTAHLAHLGIAYGGPGIPWTAQTAIEAADQLDAEDIARAVEEGLAASDSFASPETQEA